MVLGPPDGGSDMKGLAGWPLMYQYGIGTAHFGSRGGEGETYNTAPFY